MHNFISEDDIEQAILGKLKNEPFQYDIIVCDADPSKRDDLNDGTGRSSKKQCVLPTIMIESLERINPSIGKDKIVEIARELSADFTGTDLIATNYKLYQQIRNMIQVTVKRNGKQDFDFVKLIIRRIIHLLLYRRCGFKEDTIIDALMYWFLLTECHLCSLSSKIALLRLKKPMKRI